jgi:hypothetical protein
MQSQHKDSEADHTTDRTQPHGRHRQRAARRGFSVLVTSSRGPRCPANSDPSAACSMQCRGMRRMELRSCVRAVQRRTQDVAVPAVCVCPGGKHLPEAPAGHHSSRRQTTVAGATLFKGASGRPIILLARSTERPLAVFVGIQPKRLASSDLA